MPSSPTVGAIVVAAGSSRRMVGVDKLWLDLDGEPLLARTLAAVACTPGLSQLVVAASTDAILRARIFSHLPQFAAIQQWVSGGETRQDSVFNALQTLQPCDLVLIHDGARPLITLDLIRRGMSAALEHGAAIAATPVTDTIKVVDEQEAITTTLDRRALRAAQTPQLFRYDVLVEAYRRVGANRAQCTDDGAVVELAGMTVHTFPGDVTNVKVSTPADIAIVRALWAIVGGGTGG